MKDHMALTNAREDTNEPHPAPALFALMLTLFWCRKAAHTFHIPSMPSSSMWSDECSHCSLLPKTETNHFSALSKGYYPSGPKSGLPQWVNPGLVRALPTLARLHSQSGSLLRWDTFLMCPVS